MNKLSFKIESVSRHIREDAADLVVESATGASGPILAKMIHSLSYYAYLLGDHELHTILKKAENHVLLSINSPLAVNGSADPLTHVVANSYTKKGSMTRTAGEVRFIKDRGGDKGEWGWGSPGPSERTIQTDFEFNPKNIKPLAVSLRSALIAMGHSLSAHATFNRIKSAQVSPDGSLGGKGYIQKISDMRRQLMNVCEALSAFTDTVYDEIKAPHWNPALEDQGKRERDEVKDIMNDVNEIRDDPEGFANEEESKLDEMPGKTTKMARVITNLVLSDPTTCVVSQRKE